MEWLQAVDYWHWWVLAVVLVILEVLSPGVFFLWMGIAAGVVGFLVYLQPGMFWEYQILFFAVFSVVSIVLGRAFLKRRPIATDEPHLNRRGEQYVGRTFTLDEPIVNNQGKIRVDDTTWKIHGDDCEAGRKVKVSGVDGVVLVVELL